MHKPLYLPLQAFENMNKKICFYYGSKITKKNCKVNGIQRYKCYACGKQFLAKRQVSLNEELFWKEYVQGNQNYTQLDKKHKRKLDSYSVKKEAETSRKVIFLMDTRYREEHLE